MLSLNLSLNLHCFFIVNLTLYQAIWAFIGLTLVCRNHKVIVGDWFFSSSPLTAFLQAVIRKISF